MERETLHDLCNSISVECDKWLEDIGFYEKPASIRYHGKESGDLFRHSVMVANQLIRLTEYLNLHWQRPDSPIIIGLLHDVCKCDDYVEANGAWEYNKNKLIDGHGDKSVIMLAGHIQLTEEEVFCIRYHMGAFTEKEQWPYYNKAIERYPNILYTHTADMIASKII